MDKLMKAFLAEKMRDCLEKALTSTTKPCTMATIQQSLSSAPQEKNNSILKLTNGNGDMALHFAFKYSLRQSQQRDECNPEHSVLPLSVIQNLIHLHPAALEVCNRNGYTLLVLLIQISTHILLLSTI